MAGFSFSFQIEGHEQSPGPAEGAEAPDGASEQQAVIAAAEVFPPLGGDTFAAAQEVTLTEGCTLLIRV